MIRPGDIDEFDFMGGWLSPIKNLFSNIVWYIIGLPLRILYFNGPSFFGFWEGKSGEDICGQVTSLDSSFWIAGSDHMSACRDILGRKFNAFYLSLGIMVYFLLLLCLIITGWNFLVVHCKRKVVTDKPN